MKLWPNYGIIIERSHPNRYLRAIRPIAAEQTRSAVVAKCFYCAFPFAVNLDELFALYEVKLPSPHPRLCANACAGMLKTAITVTMIRLNKRGFNLKHDSAA